MDVARLLHLILAVLVSAAQGSPLFDLFLGNPIREGNRGYRTGRRPKHVSGGGYNDYRRICSVVNPNPYAMIGSNPYPAVPFCPP